MAITLARVKDLGPSIVPEVTYLLFRRLLDILFGKNKMQPRDSAYANIARVNSINDGIMLDFGLGDDRPTQADLTPREEIAENFQSQIRIAINRTVAKQLIQDLQETLKQDLYPDTETRKYMERQAVSFAANRENLLNKYAGMYVIFEDGKVLDAGPDEAALVMGYCTRDEPKQMFVKKVLAKDPQLTVAVPSVVPSTPK